MAIPLPQLCKSFLDRPESLENSHRCMGWLYRTAAVLSGVALFVIFTLAAAIYTGIIATFEAPILLLGAALGYGCSKGISLWSKGTQEFIDATFYQSIVQKMGEMREWGNEEIRAFLADNEIEPPQTPETLKALAAVAPNREPLFAFLPLIAGFQRIQEIAATFLKRYEENLQKANSYVYPDERGAEMRHRCLAMDRLEQLAYNRLMSSILLQNLACPTAEYDPERTVIRPKDDRPDERYATQALFQVNPEQNIGFIHAKVDRMVDFLARRDSIFFQHHNGHTLTLEQIKDLAPKDLRKQIFLPV